MTEKQVRERLAQLEQELADEKAKNERAQQTIADLARGIGQSPPPAWPWPTPAPWPQPVNPDPIPWAIMYYACSFPAPGDIVHPPTITYSSTLPIPAPKGKPAK